MADVSVAPKERIRIKYKSSAGDAKEDGVELPLKLMMLGDFNGRADETPVEDRSITSVDKDNFNEVLRSQEIELNMLVKNTLDDSTDANDLKVSLKIENMRDFEPDQIAMNVPELKELIEMRKALIALKGPLGNLPEFRKKIERMVQDDGMRKKIEGEILNSKS